MKFYFTYGSSGMVYEGGWTEDDFPGEDILELDPWEHAAGA